MQKARRDQVTLGAVDSLDLTDGAIPWSSESLLSVPTQSPNTKGFSSGVWLKRFLQNQIDEIQRLTASQYKEMQQEKVCPYHANFGSRGCNLGCSCGSVMEQCYSKHALLHLDDSKDDHQQVDIGVCWPATAAIAMISLVIFFLAL